MELFMGFFKPELSPVERFESCAEGKAGGAAEAGRPA